MSSGTASWPVPTAELAEVLQDLLASSLGSSVPIVDLRRSVSAYSSSFPLEELTVRLGDGRSLELVFKNLSPAAMLGEARVARPELAYDPRHEIHAYRDVLRGAGLGTARCFGALSDDRSGWHWLFLERVPGLQLKHVGEMATWEAAARWLALCHTRLANHSCGAGAGSACLSRYDAGYYWKCLERARMFSGDTLDVVADRYPAVVACLLDLPQTVIHGEFYASNVLVQQGNAGLRLCPVDWEAVGTGPGLLDVAALASGSWSNDERAGLVEAYVAAMSLSGKWPLDADATMAGVLCCRLHLAIRWLGWAPWWSPPNDHTNDWLREALHLADALDV
ncbi:MAG: aminoglycoside phosphotransferase family protein [Acidimicrobiia bacterium]